MSLTAKLEQELINYIRAEEGATVFDCTLYLNMDKHLSASMGEVGAVLMVLEESKKLRFIEDKYVVT